MRQVLSTALVALIVAALTAVTVNAVAQSPAEPPLSPTALDADTVDRLSAVKATSNKKTRANKLVATDATGFLPSNIVKAKWGLVSGKPAFLADGVVGWNEVAGIPAGFADGVDNEGVTAVKIRTETSTSSKLITPGNSNTNFVDCPPGFLAVGGGYTMSGSPLLNVYYSAAEDADTWLVAAYLPSGATTTALWAQVTCLRAEPGGLTVAAKNSDFGPAKTKVRTPRK